MLLAVALSQRPVVLKSTDEIALIRKAGRINAIALEEVRAAVKPGVMTAHLDRIAEQVIRDHGAEPAFKGYPGPYPYPATINTSINQELVHGIPGKRRLRSGDILSIDCGTRFQGFHADSAMTITVGETSQQSQRIIAITREALLLGISKLIVGNRIGDVSAAIQSFVEGAGYFLTREYTGHGIGQEMHEGPSVLNVGKAGTGLPIRAGMVIAIEPMVLEFSDQTIVLPDRWTVSSASGGLTAHFEHTVSVTEAGPLIMTEL